VHFQGQYEIKPIGVVFEAYVVQDGKRAKITYGVIAWGLHAFPPKRRVEDIIRETIDFIDMDKLLTTLNEA
jgi:hypothetical protein